MLYKPRFLVFSFMNSLIFYVTFDHVSHKLDNLQRKKKIPSDNSLMAWIMFNVNSVWEISIYEYFIMFSFHFLLM